MLPGIIPSEGRGRESVPCHSLGNFVGLLAIFGISWLAYALFQSSTVMWCYPYVSSQSLPSVHVSLCPNFLFLWRHQWYGIKMCPNDFILTWLHFLKLCFWRRSYSEVQGVKTSTYFGGGHSSTHSRQQWPVKLIASHYSHLLFCLCLSLLRILTITFGQLRCHATWHIHGFQELGWGGRYSAYRGINVIKTLRKSPGCGSKEELEKLLMFGGMCRWCDSSGGMVAKLPSEEKGVGVSERAKSALKYCG